MSAARWQDRLDGRSRPEQAADVAGPSRARARAVAFAGALAIASAMAALVQSPAFRVEQVVLVRAGEYERVSGATLRSVASVVGQSIFTISSTRVAAQVASLPGVRRARVIPRLPNVVEIEVEERLPIVTWRTFAGDRLIDDQGIVVAAVPTEATAEAGALPVVTDTSGTVLLEGDRVPSRAVLAVGVIMAAFDASRLRVESIEFGQTGLSFVIDGGTRVVLGEPDDLDAKFGHMLAVRAAALERGVRLATLDVRAPTRPAYRVGPPVPPPVTAAATATPRPRS